MFLTFKYFARNNDTLYNVVNAFFFRTIIVG